MSIVILNPPKVKDISDAATMVALTSEKSADFFKVVKAANDKYDYAIEPTKGVLEWLSGNLKLALYKDGDDIKGIILWAIETPFVGTDTSCKVEITLADDEEIFSTLINYVTDIASMASCKSILYYSGKINEIDSTTKELIYIHKRL